MKPATVAEIAPVDHVLRLTRDQIDFPDLDWGDGRYVGMVLIEDRGERLILCTNCIEVVARGKRSGHYDAFPMRAHSCS